MKLVTAGVLANSIAQRYPGLGSEPGVVGQLNASGEATDSAPNTDSEPATFAQLNASSEPLASVQAAGLLSYTQPSGTLVYVRAVQQHFVATHFVEEGDIVQVTEADSKVLLQLGRAVLATDDEVAAAQKAAKK